MRNHVHGWMLVILGLTACTEAMHEEAADPTAASGVQVTTQALRGSLANDIAPASIQIGAAGNEPTSRGCSGVMITDQFFLSADHCDIRPGARVRSPRSDNEADSLTAEVELIDRINDNRRTDLVLGKLRQPLPWRWSPLPNSRNSGLLNPAAIAFRAPVSSEWLTTYGFGQHVDCFEWWSVIDNKRRYSQYQAGNTEFTCTGDSGGPHYIGRWGDVPQGAPVFKVTSGGPRQLWKVKEWLLEKVRNHVQYEVGLDRFGADYRGLNVADAHNCAMECTWDPACRSFTFLREQQHCLLKKAVQDATPCEDCVSGLPAAVSLFNLRGGDMGNFVTTSVDVCEAACARLDFCAGWTWDAQWSVCNLKDTSATLALGDGPLLSGYRRGYERNIDRPGAPLATVTTFDEYFCSQRCAINKDCRAWSFEPLTETCRLKRYAMPGVHRDGVISGLRGGMEYDMNRNGPELRRLSATENEECQTACQNDQPCKAWTFWSAEKICVLRSEAGERVPTAGFVSGRKFVEYFGVLDR